MMMRFAICLLLLGSVAQAAPLDTQAADAVLKECKNSPGFAALGEIKSVETIGNRPFAVNTKADNDTPPSVVHLLGKTARGYAVMLQGIGCEVIPVVGKPTGFAKGNFGGGATVAYALNGACGGGGICTTVVSLKSKDDRLLDLLVLSEGCEVAISMQKRAVFSGRDSIEIGCFGSGGADVGRADMILDAGTGSLEQLLVFSAGTGWVQIDDESPKRCTARIPGGLTVVKVGDKPEIDVTMMSEPEEAEEQHVERFSGGCDATVATRRHVFDKRANKFVAKPGKPRLRTLRKICTCEKK